MANALNLLRLFTNLEKRRKNGGLSVPDLERWAHYKDALDRMTGQKPDRRASLRVPTHLVCSVVGQSGSASSVVTNLSKGGVFIRTLAPLPVGSTVALKLLLVDEKEPLSVEGVVVANHVNLDDGEAGTPGMGVRFNPLDPDTAARLEALYESEQRRPEEAVN